MQLISHHAQKLLQNISYVTSPQVQQHLQFGGHTWITRM
jgi:glycine cleavage system H lipoate-binding protein